MENNSYSTMAVSGSIWTILERLGANGVTFVVNILLARLLLPEDYGAIAMISVFISIADILVQSGLGSALIQKKDADDIDFSTIFYFNIGFSIVLYFLLFVSAPFVARFYNMEILSPVLRVMGISVIISGINNVQQSIVSKRMIFKLFFYATTIGTLLSGLFGIIAAYNSLGIWSIVIQQLTNRCMNTIVLWLLVKWRPKKVFSYSRFKELFNFGYKLLLKSSIDVLFNNLYTLVIGKTYSSSTVGYFNKGQSFPNFVSTCVNTPMQKVLFPLFSKMNEKTSILQNGYRRATQVGCFVVVPIMFGLAAVSDNLIIVLLTAKWENAIIFCKLWCVAYALTPILIESQQVIAALGYANVMLKAEMLQKLIAIILLIISYPYGLIYLMVSYVLYVGISTIINMVVVQKYLNYSVEKQFIDVFSIYAISILMYVIVSWICINNMFVNLAVQIMTGVIFYVMMSYCFSKDTFKYCFEILKKITMNGRKQNE